MTLSSKMKSMKCVAAGCPPQHLTSDKQTVMEEVQYSDVLLENSDTSHSKDSK